MFENKTYSSLKALWKGGPGVIVDNAVLPLCVSIWNMQDRLLAAYLLGKKFYSGKGLHKVLNKICWIKVWAESSRLTVTGSMYS